MVILATEADHGTARSVGLNIDDKEYWMWCDGRSVTVLAGRWIRDRRALGKTFWSKSELQKNYKRHGAALAEYAGRLSPDMAD